MKWISVKEALPEPGQYCLCAYNGKIIPDILEYLKKINIWYDIADRDYGEYQVTHWIPLPAAPNSEDAGQAPKTFTLEELNKISDDKELVAGIDQLVEKISAEINHPLSEISQHYLWGAKRVANFVKNIITGKKYI